MKKDIQQKLIDAGRDGPPGPGDGEEHLNPNGAEEDLWDACDGGTSGGAYTAADAALEEYDGGGKRGQEPAGTVEDAEMIGLPELDKQYGKLFRDLVIRKKVDTGSLNMINVVITYDSKHAICLCVDKRLIHCQI